MCVYIYIYIVIYIYGLRVYIYIYTYHKLYIIESHFAVTMAGYSHWVQRKESPQGGAAGVRSHFLPRC